MQKKTLERDWWGWLGFDVGWEGMDSWSDGPYTFVGQLEG